MNDYTTAVETASAYALEWLTGIGDRPIPQREYVQAVKAQG